MVDFYAGRAVSSSVAAERDHDAAFREDSSGPGMRRGDGQNRKLRERLTTEAQSPQRAKRDG